MQKLKKNSLSKTSSIDSKNESYSSTYSNSSSSDSNSSNQNQKFDRNTFHFERNIALKDKSKSQIYDNNHIFIRNETVLKNKLQRNKSLSYFNNLEYNNIKLKKENHKSLENKINDDYYKVNLNKTHFFIYNFYRDMIVENNKNNKSKIEQIIKNNYIINVKDTTYPFISIKNNKENNNITKEKKENNINNFRAQSFQNKINDKEMNIKEDENYINTRLIILSVIFFFIMIICGGLILYFNLTYYNKIKMIINLTKNTITLKYCVHFAKYYVREQSLLNFNQSIIVGGEYLLFPSNNITKYKLLIAEKLKDLYIENNKCIKYIFSSTFLPSKNGTKYMNELSLNINFLYMHEMRPIKSGIFETLVQYNNAFYCMASAWTELHQADPDFGFFNQNSNMNFETTINLLISIFNSELENVIKNIKIIYIICLLLFLFIFIICYFFLFKNFLCLSNIIINYMEKSFNINENFLKNSIIKCQNFLNKNKIILEKEEESEDSDNKEANKINYKNINQKENPIINNRKRKTNIKSQSSIKYISMLGIFLLIIYLYFIYNFYYFLNLSNNALFMSQFFFNLQDYQINIIDIYNSYRQFLFDEKSISKSNKMILNYLEDIISDYYNTVTSDIEYLDNYINNYLSNKKEKVDIFNKELCSYANLNFFNSTEECFNKYGHFLKYGFEIFVSHFIQEVRVLKSLVNYLLSLGNIRGKLNEYIVKNWMEDDLIPKKFNYNNNTQYMFRLNLFNNETLHNNLNTLYLNFILPYLDENRKTILNIISIEGDDFYLLILTFLYIFILLIIIICYWIPIINLYKCKIYKIKKMLSILPTNILEN